jgi:hypothetical protein
MFASAGGILCAFTLFLQTVCAIVRCRVLAQAADGGLRAVLLRSMTGRMTKINLLYEIS